MESIVRIATDVSTPIGLAGFFAAVFFLVSKQLIKSNLFLRLTNQHSSDIIKIIINRFFILSLIAMVLSLAGHVAILNMPKESIALLREAEFRINQVDKVLKEAISISSTCQNEFREKGTACVHDLLVAAQLVTVVFELGGIYKIPGKGEDTVWIFNSGYGLRHLPQKQGYKNQQYANLTIGEVVEDYWRDHSEAKNTDTSKLNENLGFLEDNVRFKDIEIPKDWFQRHQGIGEYKVYDAEMDDYQSNLNIIDSWLSLINEKWNYFRNLINT